MTKFISDHALPLLTGLVLLVFALGLGLGMKIGFAAAKQDTSEKHTSPKNGLGLSQPFRLWRSSCSMATKTLSQLSLLSLSPVLAIGSYEMPLRSSSWQQLS